MNDKYNSLNLQYSDLTKKHTNAIENINYLSNQLDDSKTSYNLILETKSIIENELEKVEDNNVKLKTDINQLIEENTNLIEKIKIVNEE